MQILLRFKGCVFLFLNHSCLHDFSILTKAAADKPVSLQCSFFFFFFSFLFSTFHLLLVVCLLGTDGPLTSHCRRTLPLWFAHSFNLRQNAADGYTRVSSFLRPSILFSFHLSFFSVSFRPCLFSSCFRTYIASKVLLLK